MNNRATIPMTEDMAKRWSHGTSLMVEIILQLPPPCYADLEKSPSRSPRKDVRWYRIISRSSPCSLLATAKISSVLARTMTVFGNRSVGEKMWTPDPNCLLSALKWDLTFWKRRELRHSSVQFLLVCIYATAESELGFILINISFLGEVNT